MKLPVSDIIVTTQGPISLTVIDQLPRHVFDTATEWAKKAEKSPFWLANRSTKVDSPRASLAAVKPTTTSPRSKSDE